MGTLGISFCTVSGYGGYGLRTASRDSNVMVWLVVRREELFINYSMLCKDVLAIR